MIGSILSGAGALLGAIGAGKDKTSAQSSVSGFASLPKPVQDYMNEVLLPRIKGVADTPYQGIPKRPLNAQDFDPIFGSTARQNYAMQLARRAAQQPATPQDSSATGSPQFSPGYDLLETPMTGVGIKSPLSGGVIQLLNSYKSQFKGDDWKALDALAKYDQFSQSSGDAFKGIDRSKLHPVLAQFVPGGKK